MTDIIKGFEHESSTEMMNHLRENKSFEKKNAEIFREELKDIGAENPTIVTFGNGAYDILARNFNDEFRVLKVPHYAVRSSKEKYREQIKSIW